MLTQATVRWIHLDTVDSTNDHLLKQARFARPNEVLVVQALEQTAGKGRQGRTWLSRAGSSLCFSLGLVLDVAKMPCLPLLVGVQLARALHKLGVEVQLKWPNDLLFEGRKMGGVLCESVPHAGQSYVVIGVGLNLLPLTLPEALGGQGIACLAQAARGSPLPSASALPALLVDSILAGLHQSACTGFAEFGDFFQRFDAWKGREVRALDAGQVLHEGVALGVSDSGTYLIQTRLGVAEVLAGDVSLRVCDA